MVCYIFWTANFRKLSYAEDVITVLADKFGQPAGDDAPARWPAQI